MKEKAASRATVMVRPASHGGVGASAGDGASSTHSCGGRVERPLAQRRLGQGVGGGVEARHRIPEFAGTDQAEVAFGQGEGLALGQAAEPLRRIAQRDPSACRHGVRRPRGLPRSPAQGRPGRKFCRPKASAPKVPAMARASITATHREAKRSARSAALGVPSKRPITPSTITRSSRCGLVQPRAAIGLAGHPEVHRNAPARRWRAPASAGRGSPART